MFIVDYDRIASKIDPRLLIYREDDYIYLLYPNPPENGNILFQETENALIVWSNEYKAKSMLEVLSIITANADINVIFPFIESEEEYQAVIALGSVQIEFDAECCENLCRDYGSFLFKKRDSNEV